MKLYTLGTSHGATEVGRACSANLLSVKDSYYLFDCGGNAEGKMTDLHLPVDKIRAVFVTHMHEDHAGTLSAIAKRFCNYHRDSPPVSFFLPEENGVVALNHWLSALHIKNDGRVLMSTFSVGKVYEDENIIVSSIATAHVENGAFPSFAFMIEAQGKKMLYTGDLASDFHDYPNVLLEECFDAVLCELVHFNIKKNLDTIANTKTKKIIFTHLSPYNIPPIRYAEDKLPFPVVIAEDNNCYEI